MATKNSNAAKANKGTNGKAKTAKVTKINAGGGIMVDVVEKTEKPKAVNNGPASAYREGGGYWASVTALAALGENQMHAFDKIIPAVIRAFGPERFKAFKSKDARNENGKDANGRIVQNVAVVARADYGEPLRKLGYEVRCDGREKVAGLFKVKAQKAKAEPKTEAKGKPASKAK
jgi:hypothetical protein